MSYISHVHPTHKTSLREQFLTIFSNFKGNEIVAKAQIVSTPSVWMSPIAIFINQRYCNKSSRDATILKQRNRHCSSFKSEQYLPVNYMRISPVQIHYHISGWLFVIYATVLSEAVWALPSFWLLQLFSQDGVPFTVELRKICRKQIDVLQPYRHL